VAANVLAMALRFDFDWSGIAVRRNRTVELLVIDLLVTPLVFLGTGLYQGYWKYTGLSDLLRVARAIGLRTITLIVAFYGLGFYGLSRTVVVMDTILLLLLTGVLRLTPRFYSEFFVLRKVRLGRAAFIIGAGDTGESLLRELKKSSHLDYNPVGFIDDDRDKLGVKIHGVQVLGSREELEELISKHQVQEVIIAIPSASSGAMREVFEICARKGARFRMVLLT